MSIFQVKVLFELVSPAKSAIFQAFWQNRGFSRFSRYVATLRCFKWFKGGSVHLGISVPTYLHLGKQPLLPLKLVQLLQFLYLLILLLCLVTTTGTSGSAPWNPHSQCTNALTKNSRGCKPPLFVFFNTRC